MEAWIQVFFLNTWGENRSFNRSVRIAMICARVSSARRSLQRSARVRDSFLNPVRSFTRSRSPSFVQDARLTFHGIKASAWVWGHLRVWGHSFCIVVRIYISPNDFCWLVSKNSISCKVLFLLYDRDVVIQEHHVFSFFFFYPFTVTFNGVKHPWD